MRKIIRFLGRVHFKLVLIIALPGLTIAGCSKSTDSSSSTQPTPNTPPPTTPPATTFKNYSLDSTFNPTGTFISNAAIQSDGKIVIANARTIGRINKDGSRDSTFPIGSVIGGMIRSLALQLDGKILVGGNFGSFNGAPHAGLIRLNKDGTLDPSFVMPYYDRVISTILRLSSGKILLGGSSCGRLNADGTLDTNFPVHFFGASSEIMALNELSNGKFLLAGYGINTSLRNAIFYNAILRYNSNGSWDTTFRFNETVLYTALEEFGNAGVGYPQAIGVVSDGSIFLGGLFNKIGPDVRRGIIKLTPDGSLDKSFSIVGGVPAVLTILPGDRIFQGQGVRTDTTFLQYRNFSGLGIIPKNNIGTSEFPTFPTQGSIYFIIKETDETYLVGGRIYTNKYVNNQPQYRGMMRVYVK